MDKYTFEPAKLEIYKLDGCDIVTASPPFGKDPFEGEEDEFGEDL